MVIKGRQPAFRATLECLLWNEATARRCDRERGHGGREIRPVRTLTVTGLALDLPRAAQAVKILRRASPS